MRHDCRHFESRTYANGDAVRKCNLDLAPEAPWRCPDRCTGFEIRVGIGWTYGSMVRPAPPEDPPGLDDGSAAAVLDAAEDFLRSVGDQVVADVEQERRAAARRSRGLLGRMRRRRAD